LSAYDYTYDDLEEMLRTYAGVGSGSQIIQGEIISLINTKYGQKNIARAAKAANIARATAYEYRQVVEFFGTTGDLSAPQTIQPGDSMARRLFDRFDSLQYTHLRTAMQLGDRYKALKFMVKAAKLVMTPEEFGRHVAIERQKAGDVPLRIEFNARAGYRVIIVKD